MSERQSNSIPISTAAIGWGIAALVLSIIFVTFNNHPDILGAGFFAKALAVIPGTILGTVGALIGRALGRVIDKPILAPVVGLVVGSAIGIGFVLMY